VRRTIGDLDVDDIIQETYFRLITKSDTETIRSHRSYLFQVAKSVIATNLRGVKVVTITLADPQALDVAADEPSADVLLSDRQELQRLIEAIADLPEPTRTIFRLRRIEQLPQRSISERLQIPESTVEKHISRALLRLSNLFGRGGTRQLLASRGRIGNSWVNNAAKNASRD